MYFPSFRRTHNLKHKQYVKKVDQLPLIKYLTSKCDKMAPHNVRKVEDLKKRQVADLKEALEGKNFFSDRDLNNDDHVIPKDLESGKGQFLSPTFSCNNSCRVNCHL